MKDIRVALVQLKNVPGDTEGNLGSMKRYVSEAVSAKADIICFPEACLTGYTSDDPAYLERDDSPVKEFRDMAVRENITIIFGFIEKDGSDLFVTQAVASPDGNTMFYRKTHLGTRERRCFAEGNSINTSETPKAVVGLQLCWEAHMPEISTTLRNGGAEIIFIPHSMKGPAERRRSVWMKYIPARAYDNGIYVCACNSVCGSGTGGIMMADRRGDITAEDFSGEESMLVKDLPALPDVKIYPDDMKEANYFLRRRPEIYDLH